ncbi:MFS transporter [Oleiharenicola lentus]|uniref:MFS transporter n=1 Tax=Oleiharenicola lentus TaxID=2508720 RepID=UPI003F67333C
MTPPASSGLVSSNRARNLALLAAFLGWMFDGLEMGIFPLIARPALSQMQAQAGIVDAGYVGYWIGNINAFFLVGAALGGLVFGWLGDRVGRVRALSLSILCYSVFSALGYFAQTPMHLGILRFLAALGMGGEWSLGVALVMEVWPEKHRPMLAGVIGAAGNLGFALIAFVGMSFAVTQDTWRYVLLVGLTPALLTLVIRLFVPESEKWKHATAASPTRKPVKEIFAPPLLKYTLIGALLAGVMLIGTWGSVQWLPSWADQMAGPGNPMAKAHTQATSAIGAIFGCLAGAWLGGKVGRRPAYFILCLGSLLSCAWLFRGVDVYGTQFLMLVFLVGALTASFFGWMPLYLPELFPTRVRATGQGFAYNAGRLLAAVGALYAGQLIQVFEGSFAKTGAAISLIYALGLIVIWIAPETKGRPLPE